MISGDFFCRLFLSHYLAATATFLVGISAPSFLPYHDKRPTDIVVFVSSFASFDREKGGGVRHTNTQKKEGFFVFCMCILSSMAVDSKERKEEEEEEEAGSGIRSCHQSVPISTFSFFLLLNPRMYAYSSNGLRNSPIHLFFFCPLIPHPSHHTHGGLFKICHRVPKKRLFV